MRVSFTKSERVRYFALLQGAGGTWQEISSAIGVNPRTLHDWRVGKFTMPRDICIKIQSKYKLVLPTDVCLKPAYWNTKTAGKIGALNRYKLYGNPGTAYGRRKGGINSERHLVGTAFKFRKIITKPDKSEDLAELVGILIGDGCITSNQIRISLDLIVDLEYSYFVKSLMEHLFKVRASLLKSVPHSTMDVSVSSINLVEYLIEVGLCIGSKLKNEVDIPKWIKNDTILSRACLRGLLDTDGCVYLDNHKIKGKSYSNINIAFTSAVPNLLNSISLLLSNEGMHPTTSSYRSVRIRRIADVIKFFEIIGSNNPKNRRKFIKFMKMEEYSSGHTSTVSKTVGV